MGRPTITRETLNALFARSGNQCAFPGCTHELVTERNLFVGQICHIEAANAGGPRFNPDSTDDARRSASNLLLLCYRHHKETDDINRFNTAALRKIKHEHEARFAENPFKVNEAFLHRLQTEMNEYWSAVVTSNRESHVVPQLSVRIPVSTAADGVFAQLRQAITRIGEVFEYLASADETLNAEIREHLIALRYDLAAYNGVPHYRNPFENRNWEMHALAARNVLTDVYVALQELEVRFYEEYIKTRPTDVKAKHALEAAKLALKEMAVSVGYAD